MLKYVNHLGETIEFDGKNFFTNSYVMRDYAWNYDNDFNKIKNFNVAGINSKTLAVSMYASSQAAAFEIFNSDKCSYLFLKTPAKIANVTASVPTVVNTVPLAVHSMIGIPSVSRGAKKPKQIIRMQMTLSTESAIVMVPRSFMITFPFVVFDCLTLN